MLFAAFRPGVAASREPLEGPAIGPQVRIALHLKKRLETYVDNRDEGAFLRECAEEAQELVPTRETGRWVGSWATLLYLLPCAG